MTVQRYDVIGKISNVRRTPQGGLDIPAHLTRTGVFLYRQPDGSVRRELRLPKDVFAAQAMETAKGAPLTVGHPGLVRPDNWQQVSVGHVSDDVKQDQKFLSARVRVQAGPAVTAVEKKELVELSCGYTCDTEETPGTHEGEKYDAIQRNILINHVALLPVGAGRAGGEVSLRMDGFGVPADGYTEDMTLEEALKEIDKLRGEMAGASARADAADGKLKAIDVDALVADRLALVQDALLVLPAGTKMDGMSEIEVLSKVCAAAYPDLKLDGKSEDYLRGLFNAAVAGAKTSQAAVAKTNVRVDAASMVEDKIAIARKRNEERSRNAWKGN